MADDAIADGNPSHSLPEGTPQWAAQFFDKLYWHDKRSQERYESLRASIPQTFTKTGDKMGIEGVQDKVNINLGGGDGGGGFGGAAAMIAALGNRNQGNDMAGLVAALGNRNNDGMGGGALAAILANRNNDGMNNMWPILLLALLGRGRGGLFGGDGGDCGGGGAETRIEDQAANLAILNKLGTIEAAIPLASAQTENVILQQTNQITNLASQAQLANAGGFAALGDKVERTAAANLVATANVNQNVLEQACQTRAAIAASTTAILQKIDQNTIDDLRERVGRSERAIEVNALRSQVEVNQTVTTTQAQAQGQAQVQAQFQDIGAAIRELRGIVAIGNQVMLARQAQDIVNLGTMTASGTQAAANTQVR